MLTKHLFFGLDTKYISTPLPFTDGLSDKFNPKRTSYHYRDNLITVTTRLTCFFQNRVSFDMIPLMVDQV
jgi:hypothetical protein